MIGYRNEHTIASPCDVAGRGYWSGKHVRLRFLPAPGGTGIVFVRSDLRGQPQCPARVEFANGVQFRTNLQNGEARFTMVEHVMAALAGLEIDNCYVEADAEEMPGLDGSSYDYVAALQSAGLVIQAMLKPQLVIDQPVKIQLDDATIEITPSKDRTAFFGYRLAYDCASSIHDQNFYFELTPRQFVRQIASSRTFVTLEQAEQLRAAGIAAHVSNQELLVIGPDGPIGNAFRFSNECARHKTLDLIGDLALVGVDLIGQVRSDRGGHRINGLLAQQLSEMVARLHVTRQSTAASSCLKRSGKAA